MFSARACIFGQGGALRARRFGKEIARVVSAWKSEPSIVL